ncbi:unnamed protein product [Closterium sp. NIES-53]
MSELGPTAHLHRTSRRHEWSTVPVTLADPSGGPVIASSSTVLPCPAVLSGSLSGLHLPSFSTNLVSTAALQDAMVTTTTPGGSSLYTLATEPSQVAASAQVSAPGQVAASCLCRLLSLPPLPPSPAPPCLPCVEGRQRAAPHSSFPPTTAPLQTLHMDVWGLARVSGQGRERYIMLVVDDYTAYTTVFPLRSKGEIPWIRTVCLQLRERFGQALPVLRLHTDRGGEFSSDLLRDFCRREGITQSFTLPDSPQKNGIAERRIDLVMEVARTSMIHAAAPHFLGPFAVRYAAHQLNLWPSVSLPETSPTLRWTGKVGDASVFRVWGSRAFVRDTSADKLSARPIHCVFLGFVPDGPGWQFYHPTSRRVLPSQDVTFDESVPFYRLFPYRSAPPPPPPLFLAPGPPQIDPLPPQGPAPSGVSQVDPLPGTAPIQVAVISGVAPGAAFGGAEPRGAGSEGAGSGGVEPGGAESEGAESGGDEPRAGGTGEPGAGGTATSGPGGAHTVGAGATGTGGVGCVGAGDATEPGAAGARGARAGVVGVGGASAGGAGTTGAGAVDPGAGGAGGTVRPQRREPASRPVSPVHTARHSPRSRPPLVPDTHIMALRPSSVPLPVPLPSPPESSLPEVRDPESDRARAASPSVARLLATAVTNPSFESAAASALVAELLDFAAPCRLEYGPALVAESVPASPPSVGGTYVDEVPPPGANIVDGMLIFRVKRPPGSPPAFKACYVARGFSQRQGVDYFQTFSPTPKMTTLRVLLHVAAHRDYELHSLDFSTAFLQGSLHEEIWLRRPPGFTGTFPAGTQRSLRRPVYDLCQAPREKG